MGLVLTLDRGEAGEIHRNDIRGKPLQGFAKGSMCATCQEQSAASVSARDRPSGFNCLWLMNICYLIVARMVTGMFAHGTNNRRAVLVHIPIGFVDTLLAAIQRSRSNVPETVTTSKRSAVIVTTNMSNERKNSDLRAFAVASGLVCLRFSRSATLPANPIQKDAAQNTRAAYHLVHAGVMAASTRQESGNA